MCVLNDIILGTLLTTLLTYMYGNVCMYDKGRGRQLFASNIYRCLLTLTREIVNIYDSPFSLVPNLYHILELPYLHPPPSENI